MRRVELPDFEAPLKAVDILEFWPSLFDLFLDLPTLLWQNKSLSGSYSVVQMDSSISQLLRHGRCTWQVQSPVEVVDADQVYAERISHDMLWRDLDRQVDVSK